MTELKGTVGQIKNSLEGTVRETEKQTVSSKTKCKKSSINNRGQRNAPKDMKNISELWEEFKRNNTKFIGVPKEQEDKVEEGVLVIEIVSQIFPELKIESYTQIQEVQK